MSNKRNSNKKSWAKRRKPVQRGNRTREAPGDAANERLLRGLRRPSELDQIGVVIVEEQLGLPTTTLDGLRELTAGLPFEPCMALLSMLAGRVEGTLNSASRQLAVAREFFGPGGLVDAYGAIISADPQARVFAPQAIYTLMRVMIDHAYDAPITQERTPEENARLLRAVIAANSTIERGIDTGVGAGTGDLLAYELQSGSYYARGRWMEEIARHRELYRLATEDSELAGSRDFEPVKEWIERSGLTAAEQWLLGFGLGSMANAWKAIKHPHVPEPDFEELLARAGLTDRREQALAVVSADRAALQAAFDALEAHGRRYMWELRPFNTRPFLRLQGDGGLLLLGRPWMLSWLGEGFHYRAMAVAQAEDVAAAGGRTNHVQNYTAYAGHVFERYCLNLARAAISEPARVTGEQPYGKGGGARTSDVAMLDGTDLVLFEANARRVSAEPLLTGDPLDAANELSKLLVKKINQLGVTIGALLDGDVTLPGVDITAVERIFPVVVAAGHVWQTRTLWTHLDTARDPDKCKPLTNPIVQPLQVVDGGDYEMLLALAANGNHLPGMLARKTAGPYRHRDLAVWLAEDPQAPDRDVHLPAVIAIFDAMVAELSPVLPPGT